MKELCITPFYIGQFDITSAFESVFGNDMLKKIHGDSLTVTEWKNNKRRLKFSYDIDSIPPVLKHLFIGSSLKITTNQKLKYEPGMRKHIIDSHMKPHILFSELFKVSSQFYLEETNDGVYFGGKVENCACLPPPLNSIAESFMIERSKEELEKYKERILNINICK